MRHLCIFFEWLDSQFDKIPAYEDGHWYRAGCWGCRMHMSKLWDREEYWDD